ncbi:MAG: LacI family transcriptional regulator [Actinobacteria bacterium]|nr:LacI family transcriptional regulator [Actinomycetota bacterium]
MADTTLERAGGGAPTIRTVAQVAGVSKSSVSRYLQHSPHLTDEAREAIAKAIKELDYRPNANARSIRAKRTHSVGVLVNDLRQPWFVEFLQGLGDALHRHELSPLVGDGRLDRRTDERLVNSFMDMRFDGLVLAGTMQVSDTIVEAANRIPTVVGGTRLFDAPHIDLVVQDDDLVAQLAVDHLLELGHTAIAHVGSDAGVAFDARLARYSEMMTARGLPSSVELCDSTEEGAYQAGRRLLDRAPHERPTAIFAGSDLIALGVMSAAAELGCRVPADLSLVGVDNTHLAKMHSISLTSVDIQPYEQGRICGDTLALRIDDPDRPATEHLVEPGICVRKSTRSV